MAEYSSRGVVLALSIAAGAAGYGTQAQAADMRTVDVPVDGKWCHLSYNADNYKPSIKRHYMDCCDASNVTVEVPYNDGRRGLIKGRDNGPQCRASGGGSDGRDNDGKTDSGLGDGAGGGGTTTLWNTHSEEYKNMGAYLRTLG
jgi:hypothetical protein